MRIITGFPLFVGILFLFYSVTLIFYMFISLIFSAYSIFTARKEAEGGNKKKCSVLSKKKIKNENINNWKFR